MTKNILVTGANGQLGSVIQRLSPEHRDCAFSFTDVDTLNICNTDQLIDYLHSNKIHYLLNCAAYTAVDKSEDDIEMCLQINRDAVQNIGEAASSQGIKVIHISTDYVFDGNQARPYREEDQTNPQSVYGQSKLAGEIALQKVCSNLIIIRTAWLYSEFGANFVKTMLRLGSERRDINVVADQIGTPTYAEDLAAAMIAIVKHEPFVPGIYHFSNEGVCSWYDFAVKIMELSGLNCHVHPIHTHEYPTRAARPAYSVLDKAKIKTTFNLHIPQWEDSLEKCLRELKKNQSIHYNIPELKVLKQ